MIVLLAIAFWGFIALSIAAEFRKIPGKNLWAKIQNHGRMTNRTSKHRRWYDK